MSVSPSGSFAKGTANASGTDIDLFISLSSTTPESLKQIYDSLDRKMQASGYRTRRQNVSINIRVGTVDVDLVPGKRQNDFLTDHSLYRQRVDSWTKTNVGTHINHVVAGGRLNETRILKLWRTQNGLDFPSFYLELVTIEALRGRFGTLAGNVWAIFEYLRDRFPNARFVDPANTNNIISDDLTLAQKATIRQAAVTALSRQHWGQIVV